MGAMMDKHKEEARKLLNYYHSFPLADYREEQVRAVTDALWKRDKEIDSLREQNTRLMGDNRLMAQGQEDDKAEIERLKLLLHNMRQDRDRWEGIAIDAEHTDLYTWIKVLQAANERLKQKITEMMGRCADLLDSDQFNNLEALVDTEPVFNEAVKTLQAEIERLTAYVNRLEADNGVLSRERDQLRGKRQVDRTMTSRSTSRG